MACQIQKKQSAGYRQNNPEEKPHWQISKNLGGSLNFI